ncbi:MAG TPA: hypothetical protein VLI06_02975, partial [Solimonas sp.]|nr:hypothetical protein [Solimonas sp.]
NETRAYIQKILWHITADGWLSTGQPQDASSLLLPVGAPTAAAQGEAEKAKGPADLLPAERQAMDGLAGPRRHGRPSP